MEPECKKKVVEIWGGVECTVVRIQDSNHDQLEATGFGKRPDELKLFRQIGIRTLRYPLIWEKYAADKSSFLRLNDSGLRQARKMGIVPIAGLLHHGSGPEYTNPFENDFPELLADYAYRISNRYNWLEYYSPVNEPLTTARFSGLYGFWFPHKHDDYSFLRIFINEMKGIVLAMKAIHSNNPGAKLVQTEDLAKIHSTGIVKYQAEFENHRRWLTYDFLTGKFTPAHPLWEFFISSGIKEKELDFFQDNIMEPDVCGFNYYISSERYLDHNLQDYPESSHGGNGRHRYADVEVARISQLQVNLYELLKEAWERYRLPMALTEVHLACTREEQLRWFNEIWKTANKIKNENIDMRAITAWSLLGSYNWNSLMVRNENFYESGAFDIRSGLPRPTALAHHIKEIIRGEDHGNHLLDTPGWWRRDIRIKYGRDPVNIDRQEFQKEVPPLLILGATGSLGNAFAKISHTRGLKHEVLNRSQLEITTRKTIEDIIIEKKPWAIINATGFTNIDEAEQKPEECFRVNTFGPSLLAAICKEYKVKLVTFSSDQVFNGKKRNPYIETDIVEPLNVYGLSKRKAEDTVLKINADTLVIRSSSIYDPWHSRDVLRQLLLSAGTGRRYYFPSDIIIAPTYIADLVNTTLDLLIDSEKGIWHLSNEKEISFFRFIGLAFDMAGVSKKNIIGLPCEKLKFIAERPQYSVLSNSRGILLASLSKALENYLGELTLIAK